MSQTSISSTLGRAVEGALVRTDGALIINMIAPSGGVAPGRYLSDDGAAAVGGNHASSLPNAAADITGAANRGGIVLHTDLREGTDTYAAGDVVPVLVRGYVWVLPSGGATRGTGLSIRYAAGSGSAPLGRVELTPVADETALLVGAYFDETAASGALAIAKIGVLP